MLVGLFEVEAFAAAPVVVVLAVDVENTGWKLRAVPVLTVWLVDAEAADVVPAPSCAEKVPELTPLAAVAVVAVAADAIPAKPNRATAAAAANRCFMM
jgi:hypothetical protein